MGHSDEDGKNNRIEFLRFVIRNLSSSVRNVDRQLATRTISLEPNENRRSPKKKRKRLSLRISTARKKKKKENTPINPENSRSSSKTVRVHRSIEENFFLIPSFSFSFQKKGELEGWKRKGLGSSRRGGSGPEWYSHDRWLEPQPTSPFPSEVDEKCVIFINCTFINFHRPNERGGGRGREAWNEKRLHACTARRVVVHGTRTQ